MRLIMATVRDYDAPELLRDLTEHGWGATQIASTGKALRSGRATVFVGVPQTQVPRVLRVINEHCHTSLEPVPSLLNADDDTLLGSLDLVEAESGGATVSVLKVARFEQL